MDKVLNELHFYIHKHKLERVIWDLNGIAENLTINCGPCDGAGVQNLNLLLNKAENRWEWRLCPWYMGYLTMEQVAGDNCYSEYFYEFILYELRCKTSKIYGFK